MHQTVNLTAQAYGGSNPSIPRKHAGVAQLARASAFQAEGRGFESRFPLFDCPGSSVVEHILGKDEVGGSTPLLGFQLVYLVV